MVYVFPFFFNVMQHKQELMETIFALGILIDVCKECQSLSRLSQLQPTTHTP